jgi:hypothetical protein
MDEARAEDAGGIQGLEAGGQGDLAGSELAAGPPDMAPEEQPKVDW